MPNTRSGRPAASRTASATERRCLTRPPSRIRVVTSIRAPWSNASSAARRSGSSSGSASASDSARLIGPSRGLPLVDPVQLVGPVDRAGDQIPLAPAQVAEAFGAGHPLAVPAGGVVPRPAHQQAHAEPVGADRVVGVAVPERPDRGRRAGVQDALPDVPAAAGPRVRELPAGPHADQLGAAQPVGGERVGAGRGPDQVGDPAVRGALGGEQAAHAGGDVHDPLDGGDPRLEAAARRRRRQLGQAGLRTGRDGQRRVDQLRHRRARPPVGLRLGHVQQLDHAVRHAEHVTPAVGGHPQQVPVGLGDPAPGSAGEQAGGPLDQDPFGLTGRRGGA